MQEETIKSSPCSIWVKALKLRLSEPSCSLALSLTWRQCFSWAARLHGLLGQRIPVLANDNTSISISFQSSPGVQMGKKKSILCLLIAIILWEVGYELMEVKTPCLAFCGGKSRSPLENNTVLFSLTPSTLVSVSLLTSAE